MSKRPFFSIPIATYNRAKDLDFAIQRILAQSFTDFELIVSDDNSSDETEKIVKNYKDKRIRYYKNSKNLGAVNNIGKVLSYTKGEYVFLHGDDDYLLYDTVLEKTAKRIKDKKVGLVRLNYLYQSLDKRDVYDYFRNKFIRRDLQLEPNKSILDVVNFLEKFDIYFISGIIFKNIYPKKITIISSELSPWFEVCFRNVLAYGGYYDSDYAIIASWSQAKKHPEYFVSNEGTLAWENFYNEIKKICGEQVYQMMINRQLAISVSFLSTIKLYSNNKNLVRYAKRILELNPSYIKSARFWTILFISYICPKYVLHIVRFFYIIVLTKKGKVKNSHEIQMRIHALRKFA